MILPIYRIVGSPRFIRNSSSSTIFTCFSVNKLPILYSPASYPACMYCPSAWFSFFDTFSIDYHFQLYVLINGFFFSSSFTNFFTNTLLFLNIWLIYYLVLIEYFCDEKFTAYNYTVETWLISRVKLLIIVDNVSVCLVGSLIVKLR